MCSASSVRIAVDPDLDGEKALGIREMLRDYNARFIGRPDWLPLVITALDGDDEMVGGLAGQYGLGWLHVDMLAVSPERRRTGIGMQLLDQAEHWARQRGALGVHLETIEFQALEFYTKLGYRRFGEQADNPPGYTRYYLEKRFD
ncbi:MAG: GNAT family N-acetyltransferase [Lysobacteraceae bacterium]|jgi:GNAT superfamily N-acetyltransferase|nr:GNAT family N-acetyltransferase [Xanthomonadaceae bacterium]MCZ8317976.1 GNAT family N-acetyltransferase [Silanimonas sp.]